MSKVRQFATEVPATLMKDDYDKNKNLSERTSPDGKPVLSPEEYLAMSLRKPLNTQDTLRMNCTSILKLLGVFPAGNAEAKRTAAWLRANNYRAGQRGKIWKVALLHAQSRQYVIV